MVWFSSWAIRWAITTTTNYPCAVLMSYSELEATLQPDVLHSPFKSEGTEPSRFHRVALAGSMATIEIPASPCGPWQELSASLPPTAGHSAQALASDSIYNSKSQLVCR